MATHSESAGVNIRAPRGTQISWVSIQHGGGDGIGYSIHAGMVCVADGSAEADRRLSRVLTADPRSGVMRHPDAGYEAAIETARDSGIDLPMLNS